MYINPIKQFSSPQVRNRPKATKGTEEHSFTETFEDALTVDALNSVDLDTEKEKARDQRSPEAFITVESEPNKGPEQSPKTEASENSVSVNILA